MLSDWIAFFSATVVAAASIVGLLMVAMSVNLESIVTGEGLPARAGSTLAGLTLVLVASVIGIVPGIVTGWFAALVVPFALAAAGLAARSARRMRHMRGWATWLGRAAVSVLPPVLILTGALVLLAGSAVGLHLVAAGFVLGFVSAIVTSWVLLIEIRR